MSRVALANIRSLTFYKDEWTTSRRGKPIPQLTCIGKPCHLYQPDAIRCVNVGGGAADVDWKCEADLPEALRFGRVEVSCEGWDGPGDPHVMKGSCGLEYRLVLVPQNLRSGASDNPLYPRRFIRAATQDPVSTLFILLWLIILGVILASAMGCFTSRAGISNRPNTPRPPRRPRWSFGGGGPHTNNDAPPPYSKHTSSTDTASATGSDGWQPGFWTGAALGGLGAYFMNRRTQTQTQNEHRPQVRVPGAYDWETSVPVTNPAPVSTSWWRGASSSGEQAASSSSNDDRGEGPSDLGRMRTSVGLGGSNVR